MDASTWARCDAERSPERGFYHHPSKHSAGQTIVAGCTLEIRRVIYSTNAIASLNARMRQATRGRDHFPNEQAALTIILGTLGGLDDRAKPGPDRAW